MWCDLCALTLALALLKLTCKQQKLKAKAKITWIDRLSSSDIVEII